MKVRGRAAKRKTILVIASEMHGCNMGRRGMAKIPHLSAPSLRQFGSRLRRGAWSWCNSMDVMATNILSNISDTGDPAQVVIPLVHRVAFFFDLR